MSVINPEFEGAKLKKIIMVVGGFIAAGIAAPTAYAMAMSIIDAMYALGILAGCVLAAWIVFPAAATWAANKRIQLLKAAAAENPIETMQAIYTDRSQELKLKEDAVIEMGTQVGNVEKKIKTLSAEDAKDFLDILDQLKVGYEEMKQEYAFCQEELARYAKQIDKAEHIWDVAQAVNKALAVNASARAQVFENIKNKVAFDTVNNSLSSAFARLNMSIEKHRSGASIGVAESPKVVEGEVVQPKALPEATPNNITNMADVRRKVGGTRG